MYPRLRESLPAPAGAPATARSARISRNVVFLGLTSLLTDISSEMVATVLPVYLVSSLGLGVLAFGVIDGLYQGIAAVARVAGGFVADRWQRHKEVALVGYALSAGCKLGLLAAGSAWGGLVLVITLDRLGKGIRTAPRDALISLSTVRGALATAFGVHRALDTTGALLGPLAAAGLLVLVPGAFDAVFVVSFCAALLGLGVLVLFVEGPPAAGSAPGPALSLRAVLGLVAAPRFRALVLAGIVLSLATISDGFVYLLLQQRLGFGAQVFPLLYVATAGVYLALAAPAGWLADRVGRGQVFLGGYALLLGVYSVLLLPAPAPLIAGAGLLLLGAYYATTDGVLMALASGVVPPALRTSGLAVLTTATGLARLFASLGMGALWTGAGSERAVAVYLGALAAALLLGAVLLAGPRWPGETRPEAG